MKHSFKFKLFGSKVHMFSEGQMGIVIEKEPQVVCVYGTDEKHQDILCAIPLCPPKFLKDAEYTIDFCKNAQAKICVGPFQIINDFARQKCAANPSIQCYGSDAWGEEVQMEWHEIQ